MEMTNEEIIRKYNQNKKSEKYAKILAELNGCGIEDIYNIVREAEGTVDTECNTSTQYNGRHRAKVTPEFVSYVRSGISKGLSVRQIAKELNKTSASIYSIMRNNDIKATNSKNTVKSNDATIVESANTVKPIKVESCEPIQEPPEITKIVKNEESPKPVENIKTSEPIKIVEPPKTQKIPKMQKTVKDPLSELNLASYVNDKRIEYIVGKISSIRCMVNEVMVSQTAMEAGISLGRLYQVVIELEKEVKQWRPI